jgi:hypothetical protein
MKAGDIIDTPHGTGTVHGFEIYPPLDKGWRDHQPWPDVEYTTVFPDEIPEGTFIRVGVTGAHPTLTVAYYTFDELQLEKPWDTNA